MAIRMMISSVFGEYPGNVEIVHDYPGHETGHVRHDMGKCPHKSNDRDMSGALQPECAGHGCWVMPPLYMQTSHVGLVLDTGEINGYDDSDFYAVVWDAEKGGPARITYASTRGWTYPNGAAVDATPEVLAAYNAWRVKQREAARAYEAAKEAAIPRVGRTLRVVAGRKIKKGTEGRCFWVGGTEYGERVGIEFANGERQFTAAKNVIAVPAKENA